MDIAAVPEYAYELLLCYFTNLAIIEKTPKDKGANAVCNMKIVDMNQTFCPYKTSYIGYVTALKNTWLTWKLRRPLPEAKFIEYLNTNQKA